MENTDEVIAWNEVSSAAEKMFKVWGAGGELEWAEECWGHFQKAGLAGQESDIARTSSLLRLVTLARIYEEFSGLAWEENPETPIDYLAEGLVIDPVALGILAARSTSDSFDDTCDEDGFELRELALTFVSNAQRKEIHACLCADDAHESPTHSKSDDSAPFAETDAIRDTVRFRALDESEIDAGLRKRLELAQDYFLPGMVDEEGRRLRDGNIRLMGFDSTASEGTFDDFARGIEELFGKRVVFMAGMPQE